MYHNKHKIKKGEEDIKINNQKDIEIMIDNNKKITEEIKRGVDPNILIDLGYRWD